jgi:hypothetical protein
MKVELEEKYLELRQDLVNKYWFLYLSALEKTALQSMREDVVEDYKITDQERLAVLLVRNKSLKKR